MSLIGINNKLAALLERYEQAWSNGATDTEVAELRAEADEALKLAWMCRTRAAPPVKAVRASPRSKPLPPAATAKPATAKPIVRELRPGMTAGQEISAIAANPALLADLRARAAAKKPTGPTTREDAERQYRQIQNPKDREAYRTKHAVLLGITPGAAR